MNWLLGKIVKTLVDNGWLRLGLSFRWFVGIERIFTILTSEQDLSLIETRYNLIKQSGFFTDSYAVFQAAFIRALFVPQSAFSQIFAQKNLTALSNFFNFIGKSFFNEAESQPNKEAFISSILTKQGDEPSVLTKMALSKKVKRGSKIQSHDELKLLLKYLSEGGFAKDPKTKDLLIQAILETIPRLFEVSCYDMPENKDEWNIRLLIDELRRLGCFNSPFVEDFIDLILSPDVLHKSTNVPKDSPVGEYLLDILEEVGCFGEPAKGQKFLDALFIGKAPHAYLLYSGTNLISEGAGQPRFLQRVYTFLQKRDYFNDPNRCKQIVAGILARDKIGKSALLRASSKEEATALILKILEEAHGFVGEENQQAFIEAAQATDHAGNSCVSQPFANPLILEQLMKMNCFEGPNGAKNKQAFITNALTKNGDHTALSITHFFPTFFLVMDMLDQADCFSQVPSNQLFIDAVLKKNRQGHCLLDSPLGERKIILILKKLEEAGCFNSEENKTLFRNMDNATIAYLIDQDRTQGKVYLQLKRCFELAGFSAAKLCQMLNRAMPQRDTKELAFATPLMIAHLNNNAFLVGLLEADGAKLNKEQQEEVEQILAEKARYFPNTQKPRLERSASVPTLSLFANNNKDNQAFLSRVFAKTCEMPYKDKSSLVCAIWDTEQIAEEFAIRNRKKNAENKIKRTTSLTGLSLLKAKQAQIEGAGPEDKKTCPPEISY